jgi:hypothetical protein
MRARPTGDSSGPTSFSTAAAIASGLNEASTRVIRPPMLVPTNTAFSIPAAASSDTTSAA